MEQNTTILTKLEQNEGQKDKKARKIKEKGVDYEPSTKKLTKTGILIGMLTTSGQKRRKAHHISVYFWCFLYCKYGRKLGTDLF